MPKKTCSSHNDCNDHGDCISDKCSCDLGWFGDKCNKNGIDEWGEETWKTLVIVFSIMFFLLFTLALTKLYKTINSDKHWGINRTFVRLFRSPKHLSLFYISLVGALRGIWISYDPYSLNNKMPRVGDRLLCEMVYPLLYGVYTCVLLVWGGLYQGIASKKTDPFRILRRVLLWIMIISFPGIATLSILKGMRYSNTTAFILGSVCVGLGIVILVFGFILFTVLLFCYIDNNSKKNDLEEGKLYSATLSEAQPMLTTEKQDDIPLTPNLFRRASQIFMFNESVNKNQEEVLADRSDDEWDRNIYQKKQSRTWYSFQSEDLFEDSGKFVRTNTKYESFSIRYPSKHGQVSHYILNLTKEDGVVFRKIVILSTLSAILGISVLLLYISFTMSNWGDKPHGTLTAIYVSFSLELFSCVIIYIVFTTQIKVEAKERLKFVTRICIDKSDKEAIISYPKNLAHIGDKLYYYF
ncbi:unnamed protein product [Blepharisma stoltei]|uniref:EGF-like domain-containing protein n=1 Tax=Blepharisma stoltei TaxID=1481888 RepID=A0AAU9IPF1_9CILI|nr:unnamed protein product [Blepharisma stoltei]